ncbi:MAG: PLD nuclease N-terminal domain-containing protein [Nanoarchaeota archaeon]
MRLRLLLSSLVVLSLLATTATAACYSDGVEVPCGEIMLTVIALFTVVYAVLGIGMFFVVAFVVLGTAFWVWMLIDCVTRKHKDKVVWLILIIFLQFLGALLYYLIVKRAAKKPRSRAR